MINPLQGVQQRITTLHHRVMGPLSSMAPTRPAGVDGGGDVSFAAAMASAGRSSPPSGPVSGVPYAELFNEAGARHGVPPSILASVGWVESRFRSDAVSAAGAVGVMQFMPDTAAAWDVDPSDPASSIDGAARLLAHLWGRFGNLPQALAAYNVGAGTVQQVGDLGGADRYVEAVMTRTEHHR